MAGRTSNLQAALRASIILNEVRKGDLPIKAICDAASCAEGTVRSVMWRVGYRSMQVTPAEREAILEWRRASPGCPALVGSAKATRK